MIRTAEQILADIAANGGDVETEDVTQRQLRVKRERMRAVREARKIAAELTPTPCQAEGANCQKNAEYGRTLCRAHRWRLLKHGDVQADVPIRCRCGRCPRTLRNRNRGPGVRVELVGDVWLAPVV